jgi:hypothetical protein
MLPNAGPGVGVGDGDALGAGLGGAGDGGSGDAVGFAARAGAATNVASAQQSDPSSSGRAINSKDPPLTTL